MPLASGTMKDENSLTFLSLSGLTRQSTTIKDCLPLRDYLTQYTSLTASGFPPVLDTGFAGMTVLDWIVYFRENLRLIELLTNGGTDCFVAALLAITVLEAFVFEF
jgi:hypothetical protein